MTAQATTGQRDRAAARPQPTVPDGAELVLEDRFSIVSEWVLDADIGDCALRLYAVLLRYGNTTGARMPSRTTLAGLLHKKSTDTVDRALAELVDLGAVQVQARWAGRQRLTNQYRIRTSRPHRSASSQAPALTRDGEGASRTDAATHASSRTGGRADAATPNLRPGLAAGIGAGRPHRSGMTKNPLPMHHYPDLGGTTPMTRPPRRRKR